MTPTQEQIDELVKRAKDVLCDYSSGAAIQHYSIKKLREAVEPLTIPKPDDLIAWLRITYPNDSHRTQLGRAAADLIEELQRHTWNR